MKQGKRPTRKQKEAMLFARLNSDNWLVAKSLPDKLHIVHRESNRERIIPA
ncbi:hypothetical protein PP175_05460 [Aneurinibacillus sp. Ricciae_BoGa-3]|uniref:DUF6906 family protein n=1 Tax=Aneurinibacillus sp. Ricciae_BoGa-3 TaxID=3022697 RepID=UPI0023417C11|nr:hypothetical protein [Aneurinibacillus sp. Ricciae_BoGa-3]WCK55400.1 hypothetical protein PP175_05460 [Aneurinibacillus sp. Ricciae_BoGa-3]